jgi:hypothetical protein
MRRAGLLLVLLHAAGCGPTCPPAREWRADLRPDLVAGGQRIVLSANVIGQVNQSPPTLLARIEGAPPHPLKMVVLNADGKTALTFDAAPERDGLYRLQLSLPGREPLPAGIYRLRAELPPLVEASFEVRHCVLYY